MMAKPTIEQERRIIEEAYAATVEPERLDDFEDFWEAYLNTAIDETEGEQYDLDRSVIGDHLARASQIIDRMQYDHIAESNAQRIVDGHYGFGFIIDNKGKIIASNADAQRFVNGAEALSDLGLDPESESEITAWISDRKSGQLRKFFFQHVYLGEEEKKTCLFLTPIDLPSNTDRVPQPHFLITSVDMEISVQALDAIRETYELTDAEADVAIRLANGSTPVEISEARDASINTIRSQIQRILAKTDSRGIPDMVRTLCSMSGRLGSVDNQMTRMDTPVISNGHIRVGSMTLSDGRYLEYIEQGHPQGRPFLLIHPAFLAPKITESMARACVLKNFRVISPSRAGYGNSDPNPQPDFRAMVDANTKDMWELVTHLGLKDVVVSGSHYAHRFAVKHPKLTRGLMLISVVPVFKPEHLEHLKPRYRRMIKTALHAPGLVQYPARLGKVLMDTGRDRRFIAGLNKGNPVDIAAMEDSEIYDIVVDGARHAYKQGVSTLAMDFQAMPTDYSEDAQNLQVPVTIISGTENSLQPKPIFDDYLKLVPNARMRWVEGAGHFMHMTHSHVMFEETERLFQL